MGKNNKARRAAKARTKARSRQTGSGHARDPRHHGHEWGSPRDQEPGFDPAELAHGLLFLTADEQRRGQPIAPGLTTLVELEPALVNRVAEAAFLHQIEAIWQHGWQPAELMRQARRSCASVAGTRLVAAAVANDHAGRRSSTLDPRWVAQVEGLDLPPADGRGGWCRRWAAAEGLERLAAVAAMVDALAALALPPLDPILPAPGSTGASGSAIPHAGAKGDAIGGTVSDPVLDRIRALLAKAESSTFEAEAMAFTAKAQELMTRHAIDAAVLHQQPGADRASPVTIRVPIDPPYVDAKSLLLQTVAEAGRCRTVFHGGLDLSTVVGFADDVAAVELLFTSLLLQAQTALADAARNAPPGTRVRSQGYRSAFLLSYTERIGHRLREINDAVYADVEADQGSSFLPALRSRAGEVDQAVTDRFGELASSRVRGGYDAAGWASGRLAADNAQIAFADVTAAAS